MQFLAHDVETLHTNFKFLGNFLQFQLPPGIYSTTTYLSFKTSFILEDAFGLFVRDDCMPILKSCQVILDNDTILNCVDLAELQVACYKNRKARKYDACIQNNYGLAGKNYNIPRQQIPFRHVGEGFSDEIQPFTVSYTLKDLFPCFKKCDIIDVKSSLVVNVQFSSGNDNIYFYRQNACFKNSLDLDALFAQNLCIDPVVVPQFPSQIIQLPGDDVTGNVISTWNNPDAQQYIVGLHKITVHPEYIKKKTLSVNQIQKIFQQYQSRTANTSIYLQNNCKKIKISIQNVNAEENAVYVGNAGFDYVSAVQYNDPFAFEDFRFVVLLDQQQVFKATNFEQIYRISQIGKRNIDSQKTYVVLYLGDEDQKKHQLNVQFDVDLDLKLQFRNFIITEYI